MYSHKILIIFFLIMFSMTNVFSYTNYNSKNTYNTVQKSTYTQTKKINKQSNKTTKKTTKKTTNKDNHKISIDKAEQLLEEEDNSITYLGIQKETPKSYKVTGSLKKDNEYKNNINNNKKYYITGEENISSKNNDKYSNIGFFANRKKSNKKNKTYSLTGRENKFSLSDKQLKYVYDIDGTEEISKASTKLILTRYQKAQIDYLEMERKCKILALDKEISIRKQMLEEEFAKDFYDVFFIDKISKEINSLATDREVINVNVDKKLRYILDSNQYLRYKQKQNKKKKKFILF